MTKAECDDVRLWLELVLAEEYRQAKSQRLLIRSKVASDLGRENGKPRLYVEK